MLTKYNALRHVIMFINLDGPPYTQLISSPSPLTSLPDTGQRCINM